MRHFDYSRPADTAEAGRLAAGADARFIAGGTNLLDLMKLEIEHPERLVDINRLPLRDIEETADGGLSIGALVANSDLAADPVSAGTIRFWRGPSSRAHPASFGTRRRPEETSSSARAATISTSRRRPATSATPGPAAGPSAAITAFTPFSAAATSASPPIRRTWPLR